MKDEYQKLKSLYRSGGYENQELFLLLARNGDFDIRKIAEIIGCNLPIDMPISNEQFYECLDWVIKNNKKQWWLKSVVFEQQFTPLWGRDYYHDNYDEFVKYRKEEIMGIKKWQ